MFYRAFRDANALLLTLVKIRSGSGIRQGDPRHWIAHPRIINGDSEIPSDPRVFLNLPEIRLLLRHSPVEFARPRAILTMAIESDVVMESFRRSAVVSVQGEVSLRRKNTFPTCADG